MIQYSRYKYHCISIFEELTKSECVLSLIYIDNQTETNCGMISRTQMYVVVYINSTTKILYLLTHKSLHLNAFNIREFA